MPHEPQNIRVVSIAPDHIESFHAALDLVARERKYLTMLQAFPLPETRDFVLMMIRRRNPQVVALVEDRVVGWCDISRDFSPVNTHQGMLGMGIVPNFRGQGLGRRLLEAVLARAKGEGFIRIELSVYADNTRAIALYEKAGFLREGLHKRAAIIDGRFIDTVSMALLLDQCC